jgi:tryptophan halogenase
MDTCNRKVNNIFDNIFDYVQAHYLTKKENTPFWKEIKNNLKLSDNLSGYLEMWKNRLPQHEDVRTSWGLFGALNYIQILHGLKWFDKNKIKKEYEFYNRKQEVKKFIDNIIEEDNSKTLTKHKDIVNILKSL